MTQATATATATPEAAPKPAKIEKNGVTRPSADSQTGKVWRIADAQSAATGAPAKRAEVLKAAEAAGINITTAATQFGRWCKFNDVKPTPAVKAEKPPKAPKAAKAQAEPVPA